MSASESPDEELVRCDVCDTLEIKHKALVPLPPRGHSESKQVTARLCQRCQLELVEVL